MTILLHLLPLLLLPCTVAKPLLTFLQCKPLDLTHTLNSYIPAYPLQHYLDNQFKSEVLVKQEVQSSRDLDPVFIYYGKFSMAEHVGTHIDSPQHVTVDEETAMRNDPIDKVPIHKLVGEACVIDVPIHGRGDADYQITIDDLGAWEEEHGRIGRECFVIIRTGRGRYWHDEPTFLGAISTEDARHLNELGFPDRIHWPALSYEAALWLVARREFVGIGTDTISFDAGNVIDFAHSVHSVVLGSNRVGIENLANIDRLPHRGATIIALPLKMEDASGSPARVIAYGWQGEDDPCMMEYGRADCSKLNLLLLGALLMITMYVH